MASVDRQNKLIVAEDWKRIYQSFKNADFQSYDFDNLRRTMILYLRENYPEDFNDYIESSEYLALIDLIAFLGQNLAFRFDLNARDNFLELAERRESVLRLARLVSYSPKRTRCANGLLKFSSITTTEDILDSNGRNLSNQTIVWNDPSNANWYEQFIKIINSSLPENSKFGKPRDKSVISGITTEQYRFNGTNSEVPLYAFNKSIDGRSMNFEVVSSSFKNQNKIYEEPPLPGNSLAFLYRDDGGGAPSSNTGFFVQFRQGSLQESTFTIERPSTNETVDIDSVNINNEDVWLYSLDSLGIESNLWTPVVATEGNNIIYNSVAKDVRDIYSVITRTGDRIQLMFADGVFGNLPQGSFKVYYRTSNGLSYSINPIDIKNVIIKVPYISKSKTQETLTISLSLRYTVNNANSAETLDEIKTNAPLTYYTQGRMITGEDYNVLPLSVSQEVIKVKSLNRTSSGISRYFDLKDASGKYSTTNIFGTDGVIYKEKITNSISFNSITRSDIEDAVMNKIEPLLSNRIVKDFYLEKFTPIDLINSNLTFKQETAVTNLSTGTIRSLNIAKRVGTFVSSNLKFITPGAMIKIVPPLDSNGNAQLFAPDGTIVPLISFTPEHKSYIWVKVIKIVGDGTAGLTGVLDNGQGPISFNEIIPTGAILQSVIPKFVTALEDSVRAKVIDLIFAHKNFALRYDRDNTMWKIVSSANINKTSNFSLGKTGDLTNQQLDSSWIILAETNGESYNITCRGTRYVFESEKETRFFFDKIDKVYDILSGKIIRDTITVLGINSNRQGAPLGNNFQWEIIDEYKGVDGYIDTKKISISFYDSDEDGVIDDPDMFTRIVQPDTSSLSNSIIFQKRRITPDGVIDFYYIDNRNQQLIKIYNDDRSYQSDKINLTTGQLIYIIADDIVKVCNINSEDQINSDYKGFIGRPNVSFRYVHAANSSARIDPSASNIIDVYMLTKTYDVKFREWIKNQTLEKPLPASSDALYINFGQELNRVKAISDEVIYHPVRYKILFGSGADSSLQAVFKVVKSYGTMLSDNDARSSVITAINEFFAIENWEFGDTFYFSELTTYIMKKLAPNIANIVIVPRQQELVFGSLYEIRSNSDEIFISSATVDDIEIISEITATRIRAAGSISTGTNSSSGSIISN